MMTCHTTNILLNIYFVKKMVFNIFYIRLITYVEFWTDCSGTTYLCFISDDLLNSSVVLATKLHYGFAITSRVLGY